MRVLKALILSTLLFISNTHNSFAALIEYLPVGGGNNIANNQVSRGNVWTAVNQSFTAVDMNILFGFYISNFIGSEVVTYTLREGDGNNGNVISSQTVSIGLTTASAQLFEVDFSDIDLSIGQLYTVSISPSDGQPDLEQSTNSSIVYAGLNSNPYAGGQFYFSGSSYDESFPQRDIAFRMTGVSVDVPQPASFSLLLIGLLGLSISRRQRKAD